MACELSRENRTPGYAFRHILVVLSQLCSPLFSEQLRSAGKERREADIIFFLAPQWSDIAKERDMNAESSGTRRRLADVPLTCSDCGSCRLLFEASSSTGRTTICRPVE